MQDDINKLAIPKAAKAYARRTGLKSMMNQPKAFQHVNAMIMNPGKPNVFSNYDNGETTDGKKPAPKSSVKENAVLIVNKLLNA